eukprot:Skav216101  [mRNA]  locus=scaffold2042:285212:285586:- [translate_table: standard]
MAKTAVLVINLTSLPWQLDLVQRSVARQRRIFRYVRVFQIYQPSYTSGHYCFAICSDTIDALEISAMNFTASDQLRMQYYSPDVHRAAFALPEFARRAVSPLVQKRDAKSKAKGSLHSDERREL